MRWTIRAIPADTVRKARVMSEHFGSLGAVVQEAVERLYQEGDWPTAESADDFAEQEAESLAGEPQPTLDAMIADSQKLIAELQAYLRAR